MPFRGGIPDVAVVQLNCVRFWNVVGYFREQEGKPVRWRYLQGYLKVLRQ